jgi:hypothetical protein
MNKLVETLMRRDGLTLEDAQDCLGEAVEMVYSGVDPEEILRTEFGLEPDYFFDLMEAAQNGF